MEKESKEKKKEVNPRWVKVPKMLDRVVSILSRPGKSRCTMTTNTDDDGVLSIEDVAKNAPRSSFAPSFMPHCQLGHRVGMVEQGREPDF